MGVRPYCGKKTLVVASIMGIEFHSDSNVILFLNVYMPCDSRDNLDDFLFYLFNINNLIEDHPGSHYCITGDFNSNIINGCNSLFGRELIIARQNFQWFCSLPAGSVTIGIHGF